MLSYNKIVDFNNLYVIEPKKFIDNRGYFQEIFNEDEFKSYTNIDFHPVQENESCSSFGVVRGLHFQMNDFQQAKLVKCLEGRIIDVALDITPSSPSFGKLFSIVLSKDNNKQLFIPKGYAHGFIAIDSTNTIRYLTDNPYSPSNENGILFDTNFILKALKNALPETQFTYQNYLDNKFELIASDKDITFQNWKNYKELNEIPTL